MVEKHQLSALWPHLAEPSRQLGARLADWLAPASDASSDADAYRITLELPGVAEDDITASVEQGMLTIRGEKKQAREEQGATWYFAERQYGSFQRSFRLPADARDDGVAAALKDGVQTINVPRRAPAASAGRNVTIKRG